MRKLKTVLLLLTCSFLVSCFPHTEVRAAENPVQATWGDPQTGDVVPKYVGRPTPALLLLSANEAKSGSVVRVPADAKELMPCKLRKGLSRKEKRGVGATFRNVRRILGELQAADPAGFEQSSADELAIDVASVLLAENPEAFQTMERDWQEFFEFLLAFLEKLIPLIISFITIIS